MKEQGKTPQENSNETEISNLPNNEFTEMVIRMINKLENRIEEPREHFNKELQNVIKNQSKKKKMTTEMSIHQKESIAYYIIQKNGLVT